MKKPNKNHKNTKNNKNNKKVFSLASKLVAVTAFAVLGTYFVTDAFAATPARIIYTDSGGPSMPVDLYVVDNKAATAKRAIYKNGYNKGSIQYSPDRKMIAFTETADNSTNNFQGDGGGQNSQRTVWVANANGSSPRKVSYFKDAQDYEPVWMENGQQLVVNGLRPNAAGNLINNVWLLSLKGGLPVKLTDLAPNERLSGLSTRGNNVIFTKSYHEYGKSLKAVSEVYSVDVVTKKIQRLTVQGGYYQGAKLSPNGKLIAAAKLDGKEMMRVVIMNSDGTKERMVNDPSNGLRLPQKTTGQYYAASFSPDWSPDGKWLAAVGDVGIRPIKSYQSIRLIDVASLGSKDIVPPTTDEQYQSPNWSSNGKTIAFLATTPMSDNIDTVNVDNLKRIRVQTNLNTRPSFDW